MNLQSLFKTVDYKGEFIWAITVISSQESGATPLCPVYKIYCNVLVPLRASLLVRYPELRGVRYSGIVCINYIGGSVLAKARCPLDGGVRYLECPLKEVPL